MRTIVTIGTFDGVHSGHQRLLNKVVSLAKKQDLHSIAITYNNHPSLVIRPEKETRILTPTLYKKELILSLGLDEVVTLPFTSEFARIKASVFLDEYILKPYMPQIIVMGHDSHFGFKREGTVQFLRKNSHDGGFEVVYVSALMQGTKPVSSTMIRNLINLGDLDTANMLLRRNYRISGFVGKGMGIGRALGFPTANILPIDSQQLIPRTGIYFCKVYIGDKVFLGLTNIGKSPTLKSVDKVEIETYIIDFDRDIYGEEVSVEFVKRLRDEKKFGSKTELIDAMKGDLSKAREIADYE